MKLRLTDNIGLKLLSVIAAIALWVAVVNINDAPDTARYMMEVGMINTGVITDNGKVFRVEDGTDTVRLTVKARRSVLEKLKPTDFTLTADMEKDLKYDSLVGITVECRNKYVDLDKNVTLSRSNVKVSIEDSATEHFPVTVRAVGAKNTGLEIGDMIPEQTIIRISGPVSIIERIKRVEAEVDVTGLPTTSTKNCKLKILDGNNEEMDTTYLNYTGKSDGMDVTVIMLNTKTMPLSFSYIGSPAANHEISNMTWKPEVVTVAGNAGVLAGMSILEIPAEAINVEGIDENLQVIINLKDYLPSGVLLTDENDASVLVVVEVKYTEPADGDEEETPDDDSKVNEGGGTAEKPDNGNSTGNNGNNGGILPPNSPGQQPSGPPNPLRPGGRRNFFRIKNKKIMKWRVETMITQKVTVKNQTGLHLRPAGIVCRTAMLYKSHITLKFEDVTANAKSVLSVLGAGVKPQDEIELVCDGEDEKEAMEALITLFESGLE